jgi:hypothetical protein
MFNRTDRDLKEFLKVRPNTALPTDFLQDDVILCMGEDPVELFSAITKVFGDRCPQYHEYRCYRAWRFSEPAVTIILSGIGTGCLEPLMYEMLDPQHLGERVPKRLVLIGTAGWLSDTGLDSVRTFLVEASYPVGCAIRLAPEDMPVRPRWNALEQIDAPRAEDISTDYYYACTPAATDERKLRAKALDRDLALGITNHWQSGRLISMETAQFYHFSQVYGSDSTQYVAFRGVANLADQFDTQGEYSANVLEDTLGRALCVLRGLDVVGAT